MIWNLFSFLNTNYRQIPWEPNLKLLLFKSYQSSNYLELKHLMNFIAIQDSTFLGWIFIYICIRRTKSVQRGIYEKYSYLLPKKISLTLSNSKFLSKLFLKRPSAALARVSFFTGSVLWPLWCLFKPGPPETTSQLLVFFPPLNFPFCQLRQDLTTFWCTIYPAAAHAFWENFT